MGCRASLSGKGSPASHSQPRLLSYPFQGTTELITLVHSFCVCECDVLMQIGVENPVAKNVYQSEDVRVVLETTWE